MHPRPPRGYIVREDTMERLEFQFNPASLLDEKTTKYDETDVQGAWAPHSEFLVGGNRILKLSLRFLARPDYDTSRAVQWLRELQYPVRQADGKTRPPLVLITIGGLTERCQVLRVAVNYNRWAPSMRPVDLLVELELKAWRDIKLPPPKPKKQKEEVPPIPRIEVQKREPVRPGR